MHIGPQTVNFASLASGGGAAAVADLAALKALTSRPEVVLVETGQAAGVWQWASGSSTTADDALVVQCTSGTAGRYKRIYDGDLYLNWFGAVADGATDSATAWAAALAAIPASGGTLKVPAGVYATTSTISVGNGSSSAESTQNCIRIIGLTGSGAGEGETSTVAGVQIKYTGSNTSSPVLDVKGPMFGFEMQNIVVNCNAGKADIGVRLTHLWKPRIINCGVQQHRTYHWYMESLDVASLPSSVNYHFMEGYFEKLHGLDPRERGTPQPIFRPTANGLYLNGGRTNNIGFSRNVFVGCEFMYGGDTGTSGIFVGYVDNCSFTACFTPQQDPGSYSAGNGVVFDDTCPNNFPLDNVFYNCPLVGGASGSGGFGNFFFPYPQSDSEPQPKNQYLRGFGVDMLFGWKSWNIATGSIDFTYSGASDKSMLRVTPVASMVNGVEVVASATGNPVEINPRGDDTNVGLRFTPKGNAGVQIYGTNATDALAIYNTARTKFLTMQVETASNVAAFGYYSGSGFGTVRFTGASTFEALALTTASAAGGAGFRLPHGTAPTSPIDGDMWTTTAGLYIRINGSTVGPFS